MKTFLLKTTLFVACGVLVACNSGAPKPTYSETRWNIAEDWDEKTRFNMPTRELITELAIAPNGDLWGITGSDIIHYDGDSWQHVALGGSNYTIAVAPDEQVWVGRVVPDHLDTSDYEGGNATILRFDGNEWIAVSDIEYVNDIVFAHSGDAWIATRQGLYHFDGERWSHYTQSDGLSSDCYNAVAIAPDNTIWAGGCYSNYLVEHFDGERWSSYELEGGIHRIHGYVQNIMADPDETIWVGAVGEKGTGSGFSYFNGWIWRTYKEAPGMQDNDIMDLAIDSHGIVWMATGKGVCRFDGERCFTYLPDETVYTVAITPDDQIWLGLYASVVKLTPE